MVLGRIEVVLYTTELIHQIRQMLHLSQSQQKSYVDRRRYELEFQVGDVILMKVSYWKGVICFRKSGNLDPRFIKPFRVVIRVGKVAYRLHLPKELSHTNINFDAYQLWKCLGDDTMMVSLDDIQFDEHLNYMERLVALMDRKMKALRNNVMP